MVVLTWYYDDRVFGPQPSLPCDDATPRLIRRGGKVEVALHELRRAHSDVVLLRHILDFLRHADFGPLQPSGILA